MGKFLPYLTLQLKGELTTPIMLRTSKVTSAVSTGTHDVIAHDFGPEAADLSTKVGDTARNVKSVTKSALIVSLD